MIVKQEFKKSPRISYIIMLFLSLFMINEISAQTKSSISGVILDEVGMPIPGANILEKGTKNAVSTDFEGKYMIRVTGPKSELVITYVGYENSTQIVGQKKTINVALKSTTSKLDEVIVIGYGTAKKSDLTGSIANISGADLKKVAVSSVAESLTGRIAGVQVVSSEGSPDAEVKIRIRGGGSLTQDSSPLIIVDGFPVNSMSDISPSDVENITVLKDASSTAIYGSRGANGVIIITTKSGKNNKLTVSYNLFFGSKNIADKIDVLNSGDYAKWQYEYAMLKNPTGSPTNYSKYFAPYQTYAGQEGINWQDRIYGRTGQVQSHDLGLRGGSDKLSYSFNYALYDESAIQIGSDFTRNNLSFNLKNKASDKVDLTFTMRYSNTKIGGSGANDQKEASSADSRLKHSVQYSPIDIPALITDDTDEAVSGYLTNPYLAVADNNRDQVRNNFNMLGSFSWKIIKNLQFKSDIGLDTYNYLDYRFYGRSTYYVNNTPPPINQAKPALILTDEKDTRFRNANTFNYDFKDLIKSDKHGLKLLLGEEIIGYKSNVVTSAIQGYPVDFTFEKTKNLTSLGTATVDNYYAPDDNLLSFFGRLNYDYKNRYLLTGTFRADGSSKFLGDNVWGYFPSVAAAWKISEESFLKNASWINSLKVRVSYGQAGNNNIPTGQTFQSFGAIPNLPAWINGVTTALAASKVMANPDLKWETTVTQNVGLDYGFFKGRLNGSFEWYKNTTSDLLLNFLVAGAGYDTQYRNMGENQNTGFEASVNWAAIQKEDYGLSISFNIGMNTNKVNSLGIMSNFGASSGWASTAIGNDFAINVGQSLGQMYGYQSDGRYEVSDFDYVGGKYVLKAGVANAAGIVSSGSVLPGMMKLKNTDGSADGIVNGKDLSVIGNANPKSTGGMVINANVYGFDIMTAFNWSYGNDAYNANKIEFNTAADNPSGSYRNLSSIMADGKRWTNLDPVTGALTTDPARLQELNANTTMWSPNMPRFVFSDWAVEDASFLRLNTLTLGYTLPDRIISKFGISKLRFYQTMSNVFVITKYSGPDPEASTRRKTPLTPAVDYSAYPRSRQVVFGLNLSF